MESRRPAAGTTLALLVSCIALGALGAGVAGADDSQHSDAIEAESLRLRCHLFSHPLDVRIEIDTHDATTEIGQWVGEAAEVGWTLHSVQLAVGQKPTGYMQGFHEVCLSRPSVF